MSGALPWKLLREQYLTEGIFGKELSRMIHSPERVRGVVVVVARWVVVGEWSGESSGVVREWSGERVEW